MLTDISHTFICYFSPIELPGMKEFLESNGDIWKIYADGMADVRIHKDLLETAFCEMSECAVIANVEELVRQFESLTSEQEYQQDWFKKYVSKRIL